MKINFTAISSCAGSSALVQALPDHHNIPQHAEVDVQLYPNPGNGLAYIEFADPPAPGQITVRDILGRTITQKRISGESIVELDLRNNSAQELLFVTIEVEGRQLRTLKLVIVE